MRPLLFALLLSACAFDPAGLDPAPGPDAAATDTDAGPLSTSPLSGEPRSFDVEAPDDAWPYTAAERQALLTLANTADLATLDDDAALDRRAAENIVAHRLGADGVPGTADDDPFDDLDELDAVPYVGLGTMNKLVAYAYAIGMV